MDRDDINTKINQIGNFSLFIINSLVVVFSIMGLFSYLLPSVLLSILCSMILMPLFIANIVLLIVDFYKRWSVFAILNSVCTVAIGLTVISFSPVNYFKNRQNHVSVVSYNVCSFNRYKAQKESLSDIAFWAKGSDFDIMALQEYSVDKFDSFYQHFDCEHNIATSLNGKSKRGISDGLAIITKHPIIKKQTLKTKDSINYALYCDVKIKDDTIRILNTHLQSTFINQNIVGVTSVSPSANRKAVKLLDEVMVNAISRHHQAQSVAKIIKESPHKVIVCADINDTPTSYTYKTLKGELKDSFYHAGFGYHYTYFGFYRTQRIDNIFVSEQMQVSRYRTPNLKHSDHKPVIVQISI